ncbi:MAG TPA: cellulase family glycosylhydrolase, partial [Solirubrobacteraceae bacterium]
MSRVLTRLMLVCVLLGVLTPAAHASPTQTMTFEAPRELGDPAQRDQAFDKIASLGARSLRVILYWQDVAPSPNAARKPSFDATDPAAYDWSRYDPVMTGAARRGWSVILTVTGPVPRWATAGGRDHVTRPSAREFQAFMTAVGKHYGSDINTWAIWNEPNHPDFLGPQYSAKGDRPLSPGIYRHLFLAAWRGL